MKDLVKANRKKSARLFSSPDKEHASMFAAYSWHSPYVHDLEEPHTRKQGYRYKIKPHSHHKWTEGAGHAEYTSHVGVKPTHVVQVRADRFGAQVTGHSHTMKPRVLKGLGGRQIASKLMHRNLPKHASMMRGSILHHSSSALHHFKGSRHVAH